MELMPAKYGDAVSNKSYRDVLTFLFCQTVIEYFLHVTNNCSMCWHTNKCIEFKNGEKIIYCRNSSLLSQHK